MFKLILKGGLGNQMFQYAATYALAKKRISNFKIDLSFIKNRIYISHFTYRNYELDLFNIPTQTTTLFKNTFLDTYASYPIEKMLLLSKILKSYHERDVYQFNPHFYEIDNNSYIEGYFNNYRYFEEFEKDVKSIFDLKTFYDSKFKDIESKINNTNSVSINIRRGDYLNPKHKDIFINIQEDYYLKAIQIIRSKIRNPYFYIFSYDDPSWFKKSLQLQDNEFMYMDKKYVGNKFKTYLRLISLCKHNIISNSTFSFWGAYLNKNTNKIVISPKKWSYGYSDFETPPTWQSI